MNHLTSTVALLVTATLAAQGGRVVPAAFGYVEGDSQHTYPFGRPDAQLQILADASELMASQGFIQSVLFRANGQPVRGYPAYTKSYKLTVYSTPVAAAQMTIDPVANRGTAQGTVVFNGALNVPVSGPSVPLPRGFAFRIPFTPAYPWQAAQGNLLLHIETADLVVPPGAWTLDAAQRLTTRAEGVGTVVSNGCHSAANDELQTTVVHSLAIVGGNLPIQITTSRTGAFPVAFLILGFTNQAPLPLALDFLGMSNCNLDVEPFFTMSVPEVGGTYRPLVIPIPNDPGLAYAPVYTQGLGWALPNQSFVGSVTSPANVTVIGEAQARPATWQSIFYVATQQAWFIAGGSAHAPVTLFEGLFF